VTKVLYVEHNDDNLYMLKTRLELRGGFEVLAAEDGEKGCRLAATEHPDVILTDLEMPDDDRWGAVRRLKNDPQTLARGGERAREGHRHRVRRVRCQTDRIREPGRDHSARARTPQIDVPTMLVTMARRQAGAP
jgi:CheY-like chemotaxis protein